ncbi:MAG TPA: membrane-bound O-acyltransferase family protein [Verrucomicrobiales bacterium]|nr:membrane-bound O-acyltransferase family protein [Verrucomicrobiales bacterium]HCQ84277.1 membrane-bound O-acyltransferase family protein [Verrucomicrobiales bacterium]
MLFHTWTFLFFFLVILAGHAVLGRSRLGIPWLLMASYVFYGWWHPAYLGLIFYSTLLDYWVVHWMDQCPRKPADTDLASKWNLFWGRNAPSTGLRSALWSGRILSLLGIWMVTWAHSSWMALGSLLGLLGLTMIWAAISRSRKVWLWASMINNLSLLFYFKYADFFIENANLLWAQIGLEVRWPDASTWMPMGMEYLLPVGISFYTFQSMSYTIDFYRGTLARETHFLRFATYVSFFPQLVAGPIERASSLLPQLAKPRPMRAEAVAEGASLFLIGLFKKLALANYLSFYVERVYAMPEDHAASALLLATIAFAWQIYFDFSGYTDMARGIARIMGYELMLNFNHPYLATSLSDFWSRWHISLSTWFRDYVYIPLGGNRKGKRLGGLFLMITFLTSAVWHGAAWTFVIWGALHALGTFVNRWLSHADWYQECLPLFIKRLLVFGFVCLAWVFFRASSVADAWLILSRMVSGPWSDPAMPLLMMGLVAGVWLYQWVQESRWRSWTQTPLFKVTTAIAMLLWLCFFSSSGGDFIYFQF